MIREEALHQLMHTPFTRGHCRTPRTHTSLTRQQRSKSLPPKTDSSSWSAQTHTHTQSRSLQACGEKETCSSRHVAPQFSIPDEPREATLSGRRHGEQGSQHVSCVPNHRFIAGFLKETCLFSNLESERRELKKKPKQCSGWAPPAGGWNESVSQFITKVVQVLSY